MIEKKESILWGNLGKAGVVVALIWGVIQIYSYFSKTEDYEATAQGNHSKYYETPPPFKKSYIKNGEYRALVKTIIKDRGLLKDYNLETLLLQYKNLNNNNQDKINYDINYSQLKLNDLNSGYNDDYKSLWTFQVKNSGNKPLEGLALEVPFKGYYKLVLPDNVIKIAQFDNKIDIGDLSPSYEAKIICWTDYDYFPLDDAESKSRFTHKNGWLSISYPMEVTGIYAWNERNQGGPFIILCVIVVFLFLILYGLGQTKGMRKVEALYKKRAKAASEASKDDNAS